MERTVHFPIPHRNYTWHSRLNEVFQRFRKEKSHLITQDGAEAIPSILECIQFSKPISPKVIKQLLGIAGYYRNIAKSQNH